MWVFYLSAILSVATALRPDIEARQLPFPQQQQASNNLWDRIDVNKVDKQLAIWQNHDPKISSTKDPVISEGIQARQNYDIPRPIPPVQILPVPAPEPAPLPLPQGCLAPRGQFPSPRSCAHYLNCWDDVVIEQQCPGGLLFNEFSSVCDFEYNVYCAGRPNPPPKPELPPGSKICPDPNGRYRSSTNCSEFYVCVYGRPVKYSCPRGLVYNEDLGVCDYPFRVDCRGATVPGPWLPPPVQPHPPQPAILPRPPQQIYYPPQQPQYPSQLLQYPVQYPESSYPSPSNPWISPETRGETDPWHQRPVASEFELQQEKEKQEREQQQQLLQQQGFDVGVLGLQQDTPQKVPTLVNPWGQVQAIPAELTKVPCNDGNVHRLTDSCSSVVVCRHGRPQLVQCPVAQTYDRVSDSCKPFTYAKC